MCELLPTDDAPRPGCKGLRNVPVSPPSRPRAHPRGLASILSVLCGTRGRGGVRCRTPLRPPGGWRGAGRARGRSGAVDPELREALRLRPPDVGRPAELLEEPD